MTDVVSPVPQYGTLAPALEFVLDLVRSQGDVTVFENTRGPVHLFHHPDQVQAVLQNPGFVRAPLFRLALGNGLLASDGDVWRRRRRLIQLAFSESQVNAYGDAVVRQTRRRHVTIEPDVTVAEALHTVRSEAAAVRSR